MGALEDDIDSALREVRLKNLQSHTLLNKDDKWDDLLCTQCGHEGGVTLMYTACIYERKYGTTK